MFLSDKNNARHKASIANTKALEAKEVAKEKAFIDILQQNIDKQQFVLLDLLESWEGKLDEVGNLSLYVPVNNGNDSDVDSEMSDSYGESGIGEDDSESPIYNLWGLVDGETAINVELNRDYARISNSIRDSYRDIRLLRMSERERMDFFGDDGLDHNPTGNPYVGYKLIPAVGLRVWSSHPTTGHTWRMVNIRDKDKGKCDYLAVVPTQGSKAYHAGWSTIAERDDAFGSDILPRTLWQAENSDNPAILDGYWESVTWHDGSFRDYPDNGYWELESLAYADYQREMSNGYDSARLHPIRDREHFQWYLDYQRLRCEEISNRNLRKANPEIRDSLPTPKGYTGANRERPNRKLQATDYKPDNRQAVAVSTTLLESGKSVPEMAYAIVSLLKAGNPAVDAIKATIGKAFIRKVHGNGVSIGFGDSLIVAIQDNGKIGVKVDGNFKVVEGSQYDRRKAFRNLLESIIDKWQASTGLDADTLVKREALRQERLNEIPTDYERYGTYKRGERHWYAGKYLVQRNLFLESDEGFQTTRIQVYATGHVETVMADVEGCDCGKGRMVAREGKYGTFYGCDTFPACRNTRTEAKVQATEAVEKVVRGTLLESYTIHGWHYDTPDVIAIPEGNYGKNPKLDS